MRKSGQGFGCVSTRYVLLHRITLSSTRTRYLTRVSAEGLSRRETKTIITVGRRFEFWEEDGWGGGNGGDRHSCGAVAALPGMLHRLSGLEGGEEDDSPSALGRVGGGRC